jgi:hypothetical protein
MWNNSNTSTSKDGDTITADLAVAPTSSPSRPTIGMSARTNRRQSFAACIMDLKIPELGTRDGQWTDPNRASTVPSTPACGLNNDHFESAEFHDVASYDPKEIRKFYTVWSTSSSKPSAGRWR